MTITFPEAGGWHDTLSSSAIYEVERRGASVEDATPDAIFEAGTRMLPAVASRIPGFRPRRKEVGRINWIEFVRKPSLTA